MSVLEERCLALAGVIQAAAEVRRVGREGNAGSAALAATVRSLFVFDPDSTAQVFGGIEGLRSGLPATHRFLRQERDGMTTEIGRYTIALIRVERRLQAGSETLGAIRADLDAMVDQDLTVSPEDPRGLKALADIYLRRISDLGPRIMVQGEPAFLNAPGNPERIRALLLGGIRAVILWRQLGGNRFNLLFARRAMLRTTESLLASLQERDTRSVN